MTSSKKHEKSEAKLLKKQAKADLKRHKHGPGGADDERVSSPAVRFAESIKGSLYVISGVSLIVALLLGQRGAIVSFDDLIENLFAARAGKIVLALIGAALLIYGLKQLRFVR